MGKWGVQVHAAVVNAGSKDGNIQYAYVIRQFDDNGKPTGSVPDRQTVVFELEYPGETDDDRAHAEQSGALQNWSTLDPLVTEIKSRDNVSSDGYWTISGAKVGHRINGKPGIGNLPDETILYYPDQPYHVVFKDVSEINPQDISNYNYDPDDMTLAANSKTNPHGGATNNNYHAYKLDAKTYNDKLNDLFSKGYVLVSSDVNLKDQTYDINNIKYDADGNVIPINYLVEVRHAVKEVTPNTPASEVPNGFDQNSLSKTATRTIHYVEDNNTDPSKGSILADPTTQTVKFSGSVYVDVVTGKSTTPETITDANGKQVQVASSKSGVIDWTAESGDGSTVTDNVASYNKIERNQIVNSDGTWNNVKSTKATDNGYTDYSGDDAKTAPTEEVASTVADGSHEDIYLVYKQ